jgi:uncharacterized damage-inducible protein DinB
MFTLDGIRQFHTWTHASLTRLLDHIATLPGDSYTRQLSGFGFPTIREQVIHIFACEAHWISTAQAIPFDDWKIVDWPTVSAAKVLRQEVSRRTSTYLSGLTDRQLNENAELRLEDGVRMVCTPAIVIHHALTHAFHHKGQIVSMCRALGHPAPDTDLLQLE